MVTIWSIQHTAVLALLRAGKTYRPDQALLAKHGEFHDDERRAYAWLKEQFALRVQPLPSHRALVWAWYKPKPDFRRGTWRHTPRPSAFLTLRVDPRRLLVSDFDAWHHPLNESPVPPRRIEKGPWAAYEAWMDKADDWPPARIERTWNRIFQPANFEDYLQAVLAEVRPADVVEARILR
jgi:hypothetical protein